MDTSEFKQLLNEALTLVSPEYQGRASEILTTLNDEYLTLVETATTAQGQAAELTERNEKLRQVNADLFLKVGTVTPSPDTEPEPERRGAALTFDALFNEKGELI